jgi:hypothetical protein
MSVFKGSGREIPSAVMFRLPSMMQAGAVEGGNRATVDHAVIRGLVTARPWCVAGLPLSLCQKSRSSRGIDDCPDRPALAVHAGW